jgi:two-component system chemotaxis sensor kinase CheA
MELDRDALLRTFQQESDQLLSELERLALDLDERPDEVALVEEMFRCAHTLKGCASCVGFERILAHAHELESAFEAVTTQKRDPNQELASLTLQAVDLMRQGARVSLDAASDPIPGEDVFLARVARWHRGATDTAKGRDAALPAAQAAKRAAPALRVDVERLDALLNLVGEVAIAEGRLGSAIEAGDRDTMISAQQTFHGLFQTLQESVTRLRLVQLGPSLERFRRAVRDLSRGAGKEVDLVTDADDVEADVALSEALSAPLLHMVRNAIDHGIETPERRRELGKDPVGRITLRARHDGHYVVVDVIDDGAGMDRKKLLARAHELGIPLSDPDDASIDELAFASGLSTSDEVTSLSGRGIGMDVVRRDIEAMRGSVSVQNAPGRGLTVSIRVPLTVAVIQGFGVEVGKETYILPVDAIRECIDLDPERAMSSEIGGVVELRGKPLPFIDLATHFELEAGAKRRAAIVVLEHGTQRAGLQVDALVGEVQTVIKPLGPLFASVKNLAGSAVMADGRVALVLDVGSLLRSVA